MPTFVTTSVTAKKSLIERCPSTVPHDWLPVQRGRHDPAVALGHQGQGQEVRLRLLVQAQGARPHRSLRHASLNHEQIRQKTRFRVTRVRYSKSGYRLAIQAPGSWN